MPQVTREEVSRRRNEIATAIAIRGWSSAVCADLQNRWGLSRRQIYREKRAVIADLAAILADTPIEERRAEIIEMLRGVINDARLSGEHSAAISAIRLLAHISGVWNTPPPVVLVVDGRQLDGEEAVARLEQRIGRAGLVRGPVLDLQEDTYEPDSR